MQNDLVVILEPYGRWDDEANKEGNAEAFAVLKLFLIKLRNCKADSEYLLGRMDLHTSYYSNLFAVKMALKNKYYMRVCHEIITLFHYEHAAQGRIQYNVIHLLEQYLED